jgi:NitT/TauT family transport system permease protein
MRAYAPIVAAATATVVHGSLADRQSTLPTHDYFGFLGMMMALGLALVIASEAARWHRPWIRHNGPLMAGAILVVGLWDFVTLKMAWLPLPYFPGPDRVLRAMWEDRDLLETSTFHSLRLLLCGYSVGVAAGLVCGVLIGWFRAVRYWGMPALKFIGPIPATAYVPLVMVMFSNAFLSSVALIAMAVWFPVTMLTTSGIANVPLSYLDVARTLGAGRGYLIFRVALPAALPSIFLGLFMGLGAAFLTLIVAETLGVSSGLGWYLKWKQGYLEYAHVYAALVIMAAFFSGLMTILFRVRDRVLGWQKGVIRW